MDHLVSMVTKFLPDDFDLSVDILESALPSPLDPRKTDDDFGVFIWVVPGEFVARHGCNDFRLKRSLNFLRESTKRFSAENSIRPFLQNYPDATMEFINSCATDANYHVRRLASEGTRPLLPWSTRLNLNLELVVPVLDLLHADNTRYVTRSVANHLNDIAKNHPQVTIDCLNNWSKKKQQVPKELDWLTRHSLRTLIRQDDARALSLLGYPQSPDVSLRKVSCPTTVQVGESLEVGFEVRSNTDQKVLITLKVFYQKANGQLRPKVFKVGDLAANANEDFSLKKRIAFKPMTTRTLYPGAHKIEICANGKTLASESFMLVI